MNALSDGQSGLPSPRSDHSGGALALQQSVELGLPIMNAGVDHRIPGDASTRSRKDKDQDGIEPPRNEHGKIICTHPKRDQQCAELEFERKCEWAKHVDKHDRPYKCEEPSCVELRGFTYSGGLLRHQREVHKKFGGPKATVFCPFPYCKRSTGTGFTRSENLKEHIRRVHRTPEELAKEAAEGKDGLADVVDGSLTQLPYIPAMAPMDIQFPITKSRARKRKKSGPEDIQIFEEAGEEDLREEIARLRIGIDEKDQQIAHLHHVLEDRDMRIHKMESDFDVLMAQRDIAQQAIAHEAAGQQQ